jgi:lysophospholipase L1-like esterase
MKLKRLFFIVILAASMFTIAASRKKIKNVLIIGDSISIGYTPFVEQALAPDVAITHNPGNGGSTVRGVEKIDEWLDNREWDVILFNFGLHDLVHKDENNKYDVQNGKLSVPLEEYESNLEIIAARLRETTATLLFVTTTMVPENSAGRKTGDPEKYNEVALKVMKRNGIGVVDLYTPSLTIHPQNSKPGNVHYTPEGYSQLAAHITEAIKRSVE